jgi:hypothetical protein
MINSVPVWLLVAMLIAVMGLAFEATMRGRILLDRRTSSGKLESNGENFIISGVFGLLALLMAFSFSMALNRFEERRELVIEEANAIGTMNDRLLLLGADAARLRVLLVEYAESRAKAGRVWNVQEGDTLYSEAMQRHDAFGQALFDTLARLPSDSRSVLLIPAYNDMGDIAAARFAARETRLPAAVLGLLALHFLFGAAMLGYTLAPTTNRHRGASLAFFALLALAFGTILDIDRPRRGSITVPQAALERAVEQLRTNIQPGPVATD